MQIYIPKIKIISIIEVKKIRNSVGNFLSKKEEDKSIIDFLKEDLEKIAKYEDKLDFLTDKVKELIEENKMLVRKSQNGFSVAINNENILPELKLDDKKASKLLADILFMTHLPFHHKTDYVKIAKNKTLKLILEKCKKNGLYEILLSRFNRENDTYLDAEIKHLTRFYKEENESKEIKLCELTLHYQENLNNLEYTKIEIDELQLKHLLKILQNALIEINK